MNQNEQNIVQAEFFLLKTESLGAVVTEVFERSLEGSRSMLVLRFRDSDGSVTRFARRYSQLDEASDEITMKYARSRGIMKFLYKWRMRVVARERSISMERRASVALQGFLKALITRGEIMIETRPEHEFRSLAKNEIHETLEALKVARHAWIFVFPPNKSLDADGVKARWSA